MADSSEEALEVAADALRRYRKHLLAARINYNPGGVPPRPPGQPPAAGELVEHAFLAGTPKRVAEQVAELRDAGVRNLMLTHRSLMPREKVVASLRMLSEQVAPKFR